MLKCEYCGQEMAVRPQDELMAELSGHFGAQSIDEELASVCTDCWTVFVAYERGEITYATAKRRLVAIRRKND